MSSKSHRPGFREAVLAAVEGAKHRRGSDSEPTVANSPMGRVRYRRNSSTGSFSVVGRSTVVSLSDYIGDSKLIECLFSATLDGIPFGWEGSMESSLDVTPDGEVEHLARRVGALLLRTGDWIAAAESLTAGHVQSAIASISGASSYFRGGVTAYHMDEKVRLLGVDRAEAERSDCVSDDVARQMARGVQRMFGTQVGIATTGYADGVELPFAFFAVAVGSTVESRRFDGPGLTRRQMQHRVTVSALELVIEILEASHAGRR